MADYEINDRVDITDVVCPMTFVKAKVAMEELEIGQVLAVTMNDGEPVQNVPRSFKEEGQQILKLIDNENVYKVNVNFDAELAEKYAVMASPTILFFKGGEEVSRIRGLVKRNALEEEVGKLL